MNYLIPCFVVSLLGSAWLAAAAPPSKPGVTSSAQRDQVVAREADDALTLKDPFSPVGYRPPLAAWQRSAAVSNAPPPPDDLKAKAKALLRVRGIVKRGNTYVANINGAIVQAGDEVGVTVDGHTVVFIIRSVSLQRVQVELRE
ncbi:MAG: hypothetical protein ABIH24_04580 [Verrucomicrobiota bacterium]